MSRKRENSIYKYQFNTLKDVNPCVNEIKSGLKETEFTIPHIFNPKHRKRILHCMLGVEIKSGAVTQKNNKIHTIYNINYIRRRRLTVQEQYEHA